MTQNQVAYYNARETERHNRMYEAEQSLHNRNSELLQARANANQAVSNYVQAAHLQRADQEIARSNRMQELLSQENILENKRHNAAMERINESLNMSQIKRNMAEISYATANTAYIQERTKTQAQETQIATNRIYNVAADTNLKSRQSSESESASFRNYSSGINYLSGAITNVAGIFKDLAKAFGKAKEESGPITFDDYMNGKGTWEDMVPTN